jgi:hypothetical protein
LGNAGIELGHKLRRGKHLLEVVEEKQRATLGKVVRERVQKRTATLFDEP